MKTAPLLRQGGADGSQRLPSGWLEAVETWFSRDLQPPSLGRVAQDPLLIEEGSYFRRS